MARRRSPEGGLYQEASSLGQSGTGNLYVDGVLSGYRWSGSITFSFPQSPSDYPAFYYDSGPSKSFSPISSQQQSLARAVLLGARPDGSVRVSAYNSVSALTNLKVDEVGGLGNGLNGVGDIRFAQSSVPETAYAYYPSNSSDGLGGDIWFGTTYDYRNPILGNYAYDSLVHELGHALGLKHGNETGGPSNTAVPADRDDIEFTIMSYRSYINGPTGSASYEQFGAPQGFMMIDILALQTMYGADYNTNSGNTTYRWDPNTGEMFLREGNGDFVGQGAPGANRVFMTTWDGGGVDTYDMSNYSNSVSIDLRPGQWSTTSSDQRAMLGGGNYAHGTVYNSYLFNNNTASLIENAIGTSKDDVIVGNQANNVLVGGAGRDVLTGGAGADTFLGTASDLNGDTITDIYNDDIINVRDATGFLSGLSYNNGQISFRMSDFAVQTYTISVNTGTFGGIINQKVDSQGGIDIFFTGNVYLYGDGGDNTIFGTAADEFIFGFGGRDLLNGGGGNDLLNGGDGNDIVGGGDGDDIVGGGNDDDAIYGDAGNDVLYGDAGNDQLFGGNGNDVIYGGDGNDIAYAGADNDIVYGDGGNDTLYGDAGSDLINGGIGNDLVNGGDGNDVVGGGDGDDVVGGGAGDDAVYGDAGNDALYGDAGNDLVNGGIGNDFINGGDGNDTVGGSDGDDIVGGGAGDDAVYGDAGNDALYGDAGNDQLLGGTGNDTLYGGDGNDIAYAGADNDIVYGDGGNDTLFGDAGNDLINGGIANDLINGGDGNDTVGGGDGDDIVGGGTGSDAVYGDAGNDTLYGDDGNDQLYGGDGLDILLGGNGDDQLFGGTGIDRLIGGAGVDTLNGGAGADVFVFASTGDSPGGASAFTFDRIMDFNRDEGDKIDLSAIDANMFDGIADSAFRFSSVENFNQNVNRDGAGSLNYRQLTSTQFRVFGFTDSDNIADIVFDVNVRPQTGDFIL